MFLQKSVVVVNGTFKAMPLRRIKLRPIIKLQIVVLEYVRVDPGRFFSWLTVHTLKHSSASTGSMSTDCPVIQAITTSPTKKHTKKVSMALILYGMMLSAFIEECHEKTARWPPWREQGSHPVKAPSRGQRSRWQR